jgi:phosphoserine aminotransferase
MGITLSFAADPAPPFHTLKFHLSRGIKQRLYELPVREEKIRSILFELNHGIREITKISEKYSICVLPSKLLALSLLQKLLPPGTLLYPGVSFLSYPSTMLLTDSGISFRVVLPGELSENTSLIKNGNLICQDVDLKSGRRIIPQDLQVIKNTCPDVHVCIDVSASFINFNFDLTDIDSFLFNSEFVFGLKPGITFLLIKKSLFQTIVNSWGHLFFDFELPSSAGQESMICHQDVDILRLFALKEMCHDLVRRDPSVIANEIIFKSILLYNSLDQSRSFEVLITKEEDRSPNIICARILKPIDKFRSLFQQQGILMDEIYQDKYGYIARFGNFPVHSKEQMNYLTDCIALH